jgi:hypothetical protein
MATKTWKLGEMAQGGVITVETKGNTVTVIGKEWDLSAGTSKGSNQSKAKPFITKTFDYERGSARYYLDDFLCYLTTSYYASVIINWIENKSKF